MNRRSLPTRWLDYFQARSRMSNGFVLVLIVLWLNQSLERWPWTEPFAWTWTALLLLSQIAVLGRVVRRRRSKQCPT